MNFRKIKQEEQAIFIISQAFYYDYMDEYRQVKKMCSDMFRHIDFIDTFSDDDRMLACVQIFFIIAHLFAPVFPF